MVVSRDWLRDCIAIVQATSVRPAYVSNATLDVVISRHILRERSRFVDLIVVELL